MVAPVEDPIPVRTGANLYIIRTTQKYITIHIETLFVDRIRAVSSKMAADTFLVMTDSDKHAGQKRLTKERPKRHRQKCIINIGDQRPRWKEMMDLCRIDNDRDMAKFLLDR